MIDWLRIGSSGGGALVLSKIIFDEELCRDVGRGI